jgi:hypothetical protein
LRFGIYGSIHEVPAARIKNTKVLSKLSSGNISKEELTIRITMNPKIE